MQNSDETLKELTLRAISDDYEYFEQVFADVTGWSAGRGVAAERQAILRALEGLISDGYAQAYLLSSGPPGKVEVVSYAAGRLDELSFYVTPKGKELADSFQEKWR